MSLLRHILTVVFALAVIVGIPVWASGYPSRVRSGADAVSSATTILDQPSGAYVVLINRSLHTNQENLETWRAFFDGQEIDFLFEDISCVVAASDAAGLELAKSFQSRLPEHQMRLRTEDVTLMLSKAQYGKFDILLMSKEMFDAGGAQSLIGLEDIEAIEAGEP